MAFSNLFFGAPGKVEQLQQFTPQQQQAINQLLSSGLSALQNNNFDFAPIEQQARNNFSQQTIPSLAERFTSMNGQRSSAFKQSLGQAASGLESGLAALKSQYGLQQRGQLLNQVGMGLTPQFESIYSPAQPGFAQSIAPALGSALGSALPGLGGGLVGAGSAGIGAILQLLKSLFGG